MLLNFLPIEKKRLLLVSYPFVQSFISGNLSKELFIENLTIFKAGIREILNESEFEELRSKVEYEVKYLIAVDGPDPDNLALILIASSIFGHNNILGIVLTGRPVNRNATRNTPIEEWSMKQSREVQIVTAARFKNFMKAYGLEINVYDGGIAPYTLVPHSAHFDDVFGFGDVDAKGVLKNSNLGKLSSLKDSIKDARFSILCGGPMTGIRNLLVEYPELAKQVVSLHAMYGSLGNVGLMTFGDAKRSAKQFNVACDPQSGNYVINTLHCSIYFITSDCTRDNNISFATPVKLKNFLQESKGNQILVRLYKIWYDNVLAPIGERIYIHDVSAAISASEFGNRVYEFTSVIVSKFPDSIQNKKEWGTIQFKPHPNSNIRVSTKVKSPRLYGYILKRFLK